MNKKLEKDTDALGLRSPQSMQHCSVSVIISSVNNRYYTQIREFV